MQNAGELFIVIVDVDWFVLHDERTKTRIYINLTVFYVAKMECPCRYLILSCRKHCIYVILQKVQ